MLQSALEMCASTRRTITPIGAKRQEVGPEQRVADDLPPGHPRDEGFSVCCQPIGAIFAKAALMGATLI